MNGRADNRSDIEAIKNARVFVTGGSGFIGRAVCRLLQEHGANVLNFDAKPFPEATTPVATVVGDIEDTAAVEGACDRFRPTHLIHLAAFASVTAKSRDDFSSIWNGTEQVAQAFEKAPDARRFVNISTQLVIRPGPQPTDLCAYDPYTPYGDTKAEAERLLNDRKWRFMVAHVRPANIWGPNHPSYPATIMRYLQKGWYLHPETRDPIIRTYGFVENCARQIVSVTFSSKIKNCAVYYAGDEAVDSGHFLNAMSLALRGRPVRRFPLALLQFAGEIGSAGRTLGLPLPLDRERVMRMSTSYPVPLGPMQDIMMFAPVEFEEAMRRTADWYRAGMLTDPR